MRYSLASTTQPLAVADYTYDTLPATIQELLPDEAQLADAAHTALEHAPDDTHSNG